MSATDVSEPRGRSPFLDDLAAATVAQLVEINGMTEAERDDLRRRRVALVRERLGPRSADAFAEQLDRALAVREPLEAAATAELIACAVEAEDTADHAAAWREDAARHRRRAVRAMRPSRAERAPVVLPPAAPATRPRSPRPVRRAGAGRARDGGDDDCSGEPGPSRAPWQLALAAAATDATWRAWRAVHGLALAVERWARRRHERAASIASWAAAEALCAARESERGWRP